MLTARDFLHPQPNSTMSEPKKILILGSTSVRGAFHDLGDIIEVPAQVAQDLINERKGTCNEQAIAAREVELADAQPKTEKAARKPKTEKAARKPKTEKAVE